MRTCRSTVLTLAAGLALSQQACTPTATPSGKPVSFTAPTTPSAADPILTGQRQVVIQPVGSTESILAVDARGRVNLTDGKTPHGLFVLTPAGDKFLIRAGKTSCLGVRTNGGSPLAVEAAPCDPSRAGQLFTITRHPGTAAYAISNRNAHLQVSPRNGLVAEERGDAPLRTTWTFVDNGPAALPALN